MNVYDSLLDVVTLLDLMVFSSVNNVAAEHVFYVQAALRATAAVPAGLGNHLRIHKVWSRNCSQHLIMCHLLILHGATMSCFFLDSSLVVRMLLGRCKQ